MSAGLVKVANPVRVEAIETSDTLKTAEGVATTVETGFSIRCDEDREQAGDTLMLLKRGAKVIEDGLRDAFAPFKATEKATRDSLAPRKLRLEQAAARTEGEMRRYDREKAERIRREAAEAQARLDAAAKAAAEQATAAAPDEEALPAAQVVVPVAERTVRGALSTTTEKRYVVCLGLADPVAAAREMPEALMADTAKAEAMYRGWMARDVKGWPAGEDAGGTVVAGFRFATRSSYQSRRRS